MKKVCNKCQLDQMQSDFYTNSNICKNCTNKYRIDLKYSKMLKTCICCNSEFNNHQFNRYKVECKECEYKNIENNNKCCISCKNIKNIFNDFTILKNGNSNNKCKICVREYNQKHREINLEKHRAYDREYVKDRKLTDTKFKLKIRISGSINNMLYRKGLSKDSNSTFNILEYTVEDLKEHLESLFKPWMNWSNAGSYEKDKWDDNNSSTWKWQIDHIIPHSKFNYTSVIDLEFKQCWALRNLRPYSAKQNLFDGNRR